ncbi:MAG: AAA family ATPase [Anaerolineales bacterium]|nr:AAA family ATPase [Anaerolineales bacterium]
MAGFIRGLPDRLTGGVAWFDTNDLEQRLADLEKHIANVKQKYLGNEYPTMEAFNEQAGEVAEPYRLLVVSDFPARFTDSAAQRLLSIATNGPGTGVYLLGMVDVEQNMPYNFNLIDLERTATLITCDDNQAQWIDPDFKDCTLELDRPPEAALFTHIVQQVSRAALAAEEVKVPFAQTALPPANWWQQDARADITVPIGRRGARENQMFSLDQKLLSTGLIIGRPGSGKSTLLHTLILSLAINYSPEELALYLIDFKQVEFKDYAVHRLPHARVVAIQSEREFGISVLRGLATELQRREDLFRDLNYQSLSEYRQKQGTLPRILLIADEFQELFNQDDTLSSEAALILDRLVRMGRAFGINTLLATQTLAGPYSLSRATKDQIPLRIALQCADADSRLILSDDNDRARLLERPGEAIYNAANGRVEGNHFFQVFWLEDAERDTYLEQVRARADQSRWAPPEPMIIFDGNALAELSFNRELEQLLQQPGWPSPARVYSAWLGEPVEIKPHTAALLRRQSGSNLLIVGQNEYESRAVAMLLSAILSLVAQHKPDNARLVLLNLTDVDANWHDLPQMLLEALPHPTEQVKRRGVSKAIEALYQEFKQRDDEGIEQHWPACYLIIIGLQRARDLRRDDGWYAGGEGPPPLSVQLSEICREGPDLGIHTLLWCDTYANLERVFDRQPERLFDMRVALQMNADDSRRLLDSDAANQLGPHRALYLDEERTGRLEKFRPYGLPDVAWLQEQAERLANRTR